MKFKLTFSKAVLWVNIIGGLGFLIAILMMSISYPNFKVAEVEDISPQKLMDLVESAYSLILTLLLVSCFFLIVNIFEGVSRKR